MSEKKPLMIYSSKYNDKPTFRFIPVDVECPFTQAVYDSTNHILIVIGKDIIKKPQMIPKLDNNGEMKTYTIPATNDDGSPMLDDRNRPLKEVKNSLERYFVEGFAEHYIEENVDIVEFINRYAVNPKHTSIKVMDTKHEVSKDEGNGKIKPIGTAPMTIKKSGKKSPKKPLKK